jgi:hypothetical protein
MDIQRPIMPLRQGSEKSIDELQSRNERLFL